MTEEFIPLPDAPYNGTVASYLAAMGFYLAERGQAGVAFGTAGAYARKGYTVEAACMCVMKLRAMGDGV